MAYVVLAFIVMALYKSIKTAEFRQLFTTFLSEVAEVADRLGIAYTVMACIGMA